MNKYPSPIVIMLVCVAFFTAGILTPKVFSPPGTGASITAPPVSFDFSSPSSETVASDKSATRLCRVYAYCPCEICCGKWADGFTSSGEPAVGLIVAAPSTIPFGTVVDIPGYGVASVQDRGGAITGNNLDVLFATHAEAKEWGVKELMVKEIK